MSLHKHLLMNKQFPFTHDSPLKIVCNYHLINN